MEIKTYKLSIQSPITGRWLVDYKGEDLGSLRLGFSTEHLRLEPFGEAMEFNSSGVRYKLACTSVSNVPYSFKVEFWYWPDVFVTLNTEESQKVLKSFTEAGIMCNIIKEKQLIVRHGRQRHRVTLIEG